MVDHASDLYAITRMDIEDAKPDKARPQNMPTWMPDKRDVSQGQSLRQGMYLEKRAGLGDRTTPMTDWSISIISHSPRIILSRYEYSDPEEMSTARPFLMMRLVKVKVFGFTSLIQV